MARAYVGVGSNIEPERNVREALRRLRERVMVTGVSTFYRTKALGRPEQGDFINAVVEVETELAPGRLKREVLEAIEGELGRVRTEDRHAPRTIDLDLIVYGEGEIEEEGLRLPDPEIAKRAFLAVPLAELAPEMRLPGEARTVGEIADDIGAAGLEALESYTEAIRKGSDDEP